MKLPAWTTSPFIVVILIVVFIIIGAVIAVAVFGEKETNVPVQSYGFNIYDTVESASTYLYNELPVPVQNHSVKVHDVDIQKYSDNYYAFVKVWLHFNDTYGKQHDALIIMEDRNRVAYACVDEVYNF